MADNEYCLLASCCSEEQQHALMQKAINGEFSLFNLFPFEGVNRYILLTREQLLKVIVNNGVVDILLSDKQILNNKILTEYTYHRFLETNEGTEYLCRIRLVKVSRTSLFFLLSDKNKINLKRPNQIHQVLIRSYKAKKSKFGREPTVNEVLDDIMNTHLYDLEELIQDCSDGNISWTDRNGDSKNMSLGRVKNFLTEYRKGLYFDR